MTPPRCHSCAAAGRARLWAPTDKGDSMYARLITFVSLLLFSVVAGAQSIEDEALDWLQRFIRIDTINPPGNEARAVDFIAGILEAEGIPYQGVGLSVLVVVIIHA